MHTGHLINELPLDEHGISEAGSQNSEVTIFHILAQMLSILNPDSWILAS
ncbi:MAG: hypothetical protein KKE17_13810 [Proteobacteria bacterium]|nr:hypothetical protein [Pseudomonadota bacterium]MBU1711074.1 hypothetical protein [Pseudomonadota bacterium]